MNAGNLRERVERCGQEDPNGQQQLGEQMLLAIEEISRELVFQALRDFVKFK